MRPVPVLAALAVASLLAAGSLALARQDGGYDDPAATRAALAKAQADGRAAELRGERLEAAARQATEVADRTAREAAALAARIQQAEAGIDAAEARLVLITNARRQLERQLAERREPLVRLTAALQKLARRPLALSALRPGSLQDAVYLRAMLETTLPQVRQRTAALRAEIDRGQALARDADRTLASLRTSESQLAERRTRLQAIESRQRLQSRQATGDADREAERALALAEQARDLDALVQQLDAAGNLRQELAALPGPLLRPASPGNGIAAETSPAPSPAATGPAGGFQLPVTGRTVAGFGEAGAGGVRNSGLSIAPRPGAQVIAPGAGRVAFAGPYRGYGRIVIIEHDGGWTSLVTGLARADVTVGEELLAGAPLGVAGPAQPVVTLELRRGGVPVNPLDVVR